MSSPMDRASAALLPLHGLVALARERCRADVAVVVDGQRAWVTWPSGAEHVWRSLLALPGVVFFEQLAGRWHPLGRRLPRFDVPPAGEPQRLESFLFPVPVHPVSVPLRAASHASLRLVPSQRPKRTSAIRTSIDVVRCWAESASIAEVRACRAAIIATNVIVLGSKLPFGPLAERFWGKRVLVPLGMRPDPDLPESSLRSAADVGLSELLVLTESGVEAIPDSAFASLTRGSLRLAHGER